MSANATNRDMRRLVVKDSSGKEVSSFSGSYALIVGVSKYTNGWPSLPGVNKDIPLVREALEQKGFKVTILKNPNSAELEDGFEKFIEQYGSKEDNRLLIYFAGHGHTVKPKYKGEALGYIVPADAPDPHVDLRRFRRLAISMQRIEEYSLNIDARHVLFLFDSCFSGSLFAMSRAIPQHINYKTGKPVRQYITSGSADETVPDESLFRAQFIDALNGDGDVNGDGYVTGSELGEFLQQTVLNYSKGSQHPQYGKIRHRFLDKGDFVFLAGKFKEGESYYSGAGKSSTGLNVLQSDKYKNNCTHTRMDVNISPENGEETIFPVNTGGGYKELFFVRNTESYIGVWQREKGIIKSDTCNEWWRISNVLPVSTNKAMVLGGAGCTFTIPLTKNTDLPDAQIVFYPYYMSEIGRMDGEGNYFYYVWGSDEPIMLKSQQRREWSEVKAMEPACYDIYIHTKDSL